MTSGTITPDHAGVRAGRDGFAQLLRAEWIKFRTVRGWVIATAAGALVMVVVGLLAASGFRCGGPGIGGCPAVPVGPGGQPVADKFYFVHQPLDGDGSITARVISLTGLITYPPPHHDAIVPGVVPWAKAGIIVKQSTRQGSAYAAVMVTGSHGIRMQYDYTHDVAGRPGAVSAASPRWLRLTRHGDTLTGYQSADGTHWTRIGVAHLAGLPGTVQAGLFVTSPADVEVSSGLNGGFAGRLTRGTAVFDHVGLQGTAPRGAWARDEVGHVAGAPALSVGQVKEAGGRFTVSGSGDIAPLVHGVGIEDTLLGAFAGLIVLIVVATMFVTAEYRRGLIRTTLAASPRRGRVLAAKAAVIGSVTFVAGLAGAAVAVQLGERILRADGNALYPVSLLTQVRVVAGTAAVLAVAAVLALGVGTLLRRSAVAVTAVIVTIVLPYLLAMASVLPAGTSEWLLRLTPAAAFAIQQSLPRYPQVISAYTPSSGHFPLAPWAGFAVLCAWAALALGVAAWQLRRRDA